MTELEELTELILDICPDLEMFRVAHFVAQAILKKYDLKEKV